MSRNVRIGHPLAAVFVFAGLIVSGCTTAKVERPPSGPAQVAVVSLQPERIVLTTELSGRTSAYLVAEIRPQVNGLIQKREFQEGAFVREGDLLYQIDPTPYQAALNQAQAALTTAEADLVVGAFQYDHGQIDEGQVSVFYGSATGLSTVANWTAEGDQAGAYFGRSAATAGDVNGDGYDDVLIGVPYYDNGQTQEGRVLVYHGSAGGLPVIIGAGQPDVKAPYRRLFEQVQRLAGSQAGAVSPVAPVFERQPKPDEPEG